MEDGGEIADGGLIEKVSDVVGDLITGVPAPIRKNVFKALSQLCTATVDLPVAWLESKAKEIRAVSDARVKVVGSTGDEIAAQVKVPIEYAQAAVKRYGQKIVRERVNLDKICDVAVKQIAAEFEQHQKVVEASPEPAKPQDATISDDWLNTFEIEGAPKSSEEMQLLFGRILAGEIQRPGTFSIKTLKTMGEIDSTVAGLFQNLCSLATGLYIGDGFFDLRVNALGQNAAANALAKFGLPFATLNLLNQYGLIIADYNSYFDYNVFVTEEASVSIPFLYQDTFWKLNGNRREGGFNQHGVAFSKVGQELFGIVQTEETQAYTDALREWFQAKGYEMMKVEG